MIKSLVLIISLFSVVCFANKPQEEGLNNDFVFNLYRDVSLHDNSDNILLSPLSASIPLSMLINGAEGRTSDEIKRVLGYERITAKAINIFNRDLLSELASIDGTVEFKVANSLWINHEFEVKTPFNRAVNLRYGTKISNLDFSDYYSVDQINKWCKRATKGRIPEIIDDLDNSMPLYILNALYFKGKWAIPFNPNMTTKMDFTSSKGISSKVDMMKLKSKMQYYQNSMFEMLEMEYGNGSYVMDIILPKEGNCILDVLKHLNNMNWGTWISELSKMELDIQLPKFSLEYDIDLVESLKVLGMRLPFHYSANFSKISEESPLFVGVFKQKTFIEVTEAGTEAAAVTAVGMVGTSFNPSPSKFFHVNRPFIFILRERTSDTILFIGEVNSI